MYNYLYWCFSFCVCTWIWINTCSHLLSAWRTSFRIFGKMLTKNSIFLCLGQPIFHLHFWKVFLLDIRFLIDGCFSFSTLTMPFHHFLASVTSDEKSTDSPIRTPLYVASHFSCFFQILICLCLSAFLLWCL